MNDERVNTERFITASELASYAYCRRAWWLRAVQGIETREGNERFERGHAAHRSHARLLGAARALGVLALLLAVIALLYLYTR